MIDRASIMAWNEFVPWTDFAMVEQDLIISRALVDIFSDDFLREQLAFRGGTALHKLYLSPQIRYSEDIDLVQINPGPIKPILFRLGEVLSWMPDKVIKPKRHNNTMLFRMRSSRTYMPPALTTTGMLPQQECSTRRCRTKCTLLCMVIQQQN